MMLMCWWVHRYSSQWSWGYLMFSSLHTRSRRVESLGPSCCPAPETKPSRCGMSALACALWHWWGMIRNQEPQSNGFPSIFNGNGDFDSPRTFVVGRSWQLGSWDACPPRRQVHSFLRGWQNPKDLGLQEQALHEDPVRPWTFCYLSG